MSGRTLQTPTFELKDGKVSVLAEGTGHVVACVDSHRLVAGPLHGETVKSIEQKEPGWVNLNLGRYVGHRLHLEFVPAKDAQLSVRMVVQGLDGSGLAAIDQRLTATNRSFSAYSRSAEGMFGPASKLEEEVFADFESGTYDGWTVTGNAFGTIPQTLETIGAYQGKINGAGKYFVNSHNIRGGGDVAFGDSLTGTLTSRPFTFNLTRSNFLLVAALIAIRPVFIS